MAEDIFADGLALASASSGTMEFEIMRQSAMLNRQSADVDPMMVYREMYVNAWQANGAGVLIDVDWAMVRQHGVYKSSIIDNGSGMAPDMLAKYLVRVADADMTRNFGWGCRIATIANNGLGTIYRTMVAPGEGALAMLRTQKDGKSGMGLWDFEETGQIDALGLDDVYFHPFIRKAGHGTEVVLLGNSREENTFQQSSDMDLEKWLTQRFFDLTIPLKVRHFDGTNPAKWPDKKPRGGLSLIVGMRQTLNDNSRFQATIQCEEVQATFYVWLMNKRPTNLTASTDSFNRAAHFGSVYEGEVYESTYSRAGIREFGFTQTAPAAVVYVEPWNATPNTQRQALRISGKSLPWKRYHKAFNEIFKNHRKMAPVRQLEKSIDKKSAKGGLDKASIERDLAKWRERYVGYDEYVRKAKGAVVVTGRGGLDSGNEHTGEGGKGGGSGGRGGKDGSGGTTSTSPKTEVAGGEEVKGKDKKKKGIRAAKRKRTLIPPDFYWITNPDEHGIAGRGGVYIETSNKLMLNALYAPVVRTIDLFALELGLEDKKFTIEGMVRDEFARAVIFALDDIRRKRNTAHWDDVTLEKQFAPESISIILDTLPFVCDGTLARTISIKLGSKKSRGKK